MWHQMPELAFLKTLWVSWGIVGPPTRSSWPTDLGSSSAEIDMGLAKQTSPALQV